MSSDHFITLSQTGRVESIHSGPFVATEARVDTRLIPAHLLNRGDESGLCIARFRDRLRRGDHEGLAHVECIGGALDPLVDVFAV